MILSIDSIKKTNSTGCDSCFYFIFLNLHYLFIFIRNVNSFTVLQIFKKNKKSVLVCKEFGACLRFIHTKNNNKKKSENQEQSAFISVASHS